MMKSYVKPELNTTLFETEDIITASGNTQPTAVAPRTFSTAVETPAVDASEAFK